MAWQRDRQKERLWRKLTREQVRSGLSVREFCESRGLVEGSFYFWRRELRARDAEDQRVKRTASSAGIGATSSAPSFAAITVSGWESPSSALELVLANGVRVRVPVGFDRQTLRELLSVLEQPAC
jgi:hypothetical protein